MRRRAILAWALYDFGNSSFAAVIVATVYAAWYAQEIVGNERGAGDLWWGRAISLSMAIVSLSAPLLGGIADRSGLRRPLLACFTALAVAATAAMATVRPGMVLRGFALAVVGNIGFEGALAFYNAWLPEIAPPHLQGRVSGWGFAAGYLGSLVALMAALPFVGGGDPSGAFLVTAALFGAFAFPAIALLPAPPPARMPALSAARAGLAETLRTVRLIARRPALRRFLLAYFAYEDGVNTIIAFSAVFAAATLGFTLKQLVVLYAVVQISALVGALAWAAPTDRLGPKRVVALMLGQWLLVAVAAFFVETQGAFYIVAVLAGTGLGAVQAASRALLASLVPRGMEAELFGFYSLCGKSAAIMGPLVFGAVSHATGGNQRLAILTVGAFFLIGLILLRRIPPPTPEDRAEAP